MTANNVQLIVDNALCTACGACAGVCPSKAIQMRDNPAGFLSSHIDPKECVHCGLCLKICPSYHLNCPSLPENLLTGDCLAGYIGYATSDDLRLQSQSGGIVSALLLYLLDHALIDGAVINHFDPVTNRPKAILATTHDTIFQGCGSYYTQTPIIEEVFAHQDKKTAAVLLGCQSESLQLMQEKMKHLRLPEYRIGLICAGTFSGKMIDDLVEKTPCAPHHEKVIRFRFRDKQIGGWPGDVLIETDQQHYQLNKRNRFRLKAIYEAHRCLPCYDQMNVFADIVCGDPWGIHPPDEKLGYTVVIARTQKGIKLLNEAREAGYIEFKPLSAEKINAGQTVENRHRNKVLASHAVFSRHGWLYPYPKSVLDSLKATPPVPRKALSDYSSRLNQSRKHYLSSRPSTAQRRVRYMKLKRVLKLIVHLPLYMLKKFAP